MSTITVPAGALRAAMVCQAKNDIRYYLNGIFIGKNGDVVGTDGRTCSIVFGAVKGNKSDVIVKFAGSIPMSSESVTLDMKRCVAETDDKKYIGFEVIDGKYPDYGRIIKPQMHREKVVDWINLNPEYLALVGKVFHHKNLSSPERKWKGKRWSAMDAPITLHSPENHKESLYVSRDNQLLVIMPMRHTKDEDPITYIPGTPPEEKAPAKKAPPKRKVAPKKKAPARKRTAK